MWIDPQIHCVTPSKRLLKITILEHIIYYFLKVILIIISYQSKEALEKEVLNLLCHLLLRYEDFADFYNNPNVVQDGTGTPSSRCGDQSASQPITTFQGVVDDLLTDIRDATPKASNFYVALTREIASDNATVYAIGQCDGNKIPCQNCMNAAYNELNNCLPRTEGWFFDMGCFARYSTTPFFNNNQTTDITSVLKGEATSFNFLKQSILRI